MNFILIYHIVPKFSVGVTVCEKCSVSARQRNVLIRKMSVSLPAGNRYTFSLKTTKTETEARYMGRDI